MPAREHSGVNDEYGHDVRVIDGTIKAIGTWLAEHPENLKDADKLPHSSGGLCEPFLTKDKRIVGHKSIKAFLPTGNWSDRKIKESLRRLKAIAKGKLGLSGVNPDKLLIYF